MSHRCPIRRTMMRTVHPLLCLLRRREWDEYHQTPSCSHESHYQLLISPMLFADHLSTLPTLADFLIRITLSDGSSMTIENIDGKKWSLRLLQAFLGDKTERNDHFPIEDFCEHYDAWLADPSGHHTTINFLYQYNTIGWNIRKIWQV